MREFEEQYKKLKNLPEWPPKDEYDLYYSHRMIYRAALEWRLKSEFCNPASRQEIEQELHE